MRRWGVPSDFGEIAAYLAEQNHPVYGNAVDVAALYREYQAKGFAFLPYAADYPTFGLSLASPEWVMRKLQTISHAKIVAFQEGGWGQDVIALRKNPFPLWR